MKIGIFYFSTNPSKKRQRIVVDKHTWGYVRVEVFSSGDLLEALDQARPQSDEVVMNSHVVAE